MPEFDVFVPVPDSIAARTVAPGSAVVSPQDGDRAPEGCRQCDYEGNIYGDDCLETFGARLLHAAGRAAQRYPTVARANFPTDDLISMGWYDQATKRFTLTGDRAVLEEWIGKPLTEAEISY